jgi:GT2 family glycosyltransferase
MIRRDVYIQQGGLDATFFAHQEEIDLCWRLNCRGYVVMAVPQAVVYHLGGGALGYESPRKTFLNFRNNLLMLYKNLPAIPFASVFFVRFFLDYIAAVQMLCAGKWQNAWAVVQARWAYWRLKRQYRDIRKKNIRLAVQPYPPTISQRSIIFDFYLCGKRK